MLKVGLVAVSSMEGLYLKDWLEWHYALGFDHICLYDACDDPLTFKIAQPYVWKNKLSFIPAIGKPIQWEAYANAFSRFKIFDFIFVCDLDEYLVLNKTTDVKTFLNDYNDPQIGSISIPWTCFGSSGHTKFEDVPVWKRFCHCVNYKEANHTRHVKSFVRPSAISFVNDPHFFHVKPGFRRINTSNNDINTSEFKWDAIPGDVAYVNHYSLRSLEEWGTKMQRGSADMHHLNPETHRTIDRFHNADKACNHFSTAIWDLAKRLRQEGKLLDERYSV